MELYAIRYGENFAYAKYNTIYRDKGNSEEIVEFIFLYYMAKYNGKIILFDTGFRDKTTAINMGITLIDVENEVENIIGNRDCIDTIFITHSHFDHIDNLDLYKNSCIVISKLEYDTANNKSSNSIKARLKASSIITVEEEYIFDGKFSFKVIGGHTVGSSVIYFEEGKKRYVITGDECYMCDNILKNVPNGLYTDGQKNEKFIYNAYNEGLIPLPFHDVKVFENYEQKSKNIVKII